MKTNKSMFKTILMSYALFCSSMLFASPQKEAFIARMNRDVEIKKMKIAESLAKLDVLTNDVAKFRAEYNSIDVPRTKTITNRLSKTAFTTRDVEIPIAQRRTMRMKAALKSKILNELHCKYFGCTMRGMLKEYEDELEIAKESYLETQRQLTQNNTRYLSQIQKLEDKRKAEFKKQIKNIDAEIDKLKSARKSHCETRKRNFRTGGLSTPKECAEMSPQQTVGGFSHNQRLYRSLCYSCQSYNQQIERLMNERKSAEQIYESAKWSNQRSDIVDEKSTLSDKQLAAADYRNSQHSMYLIFKEKILQKFIDKLQQKIDEEQNQIAELSKDIETSIMITQNPDLITDRQISSINMKKFDDAMNRKFGIGSDGMSVEERAIHMKKLQQEENERKVRLIQEIAERRRLADEERADRRLADEREHELQKLRIKAQTDIESARIFGDAMKNMKITVDPNQKTGNN